MHIWSCVALHCLNSSGTDWKIVAHAARLIQEQTGACNSHMNFTICGGSLNKMGRLELDSLCIYKKYFSIQAFGKQTTVKFLRYSAVTLEEKNCCSLESLPLILLTFFLYLSRNQDDFFVGSSASILKGCRDSAQGAELLWRAPLGAATFIFPPWGRIERSLISFTCQKEAGSPRGPRERPLPPLAHGGVGTVRAVRALCFSLC